MSEELQETKISDKTIGSGEKVFSISISMSAPVLYDYLIYHAYSSAAGILGTCFGTLGILMFFNSGMQNFLFLILGIVLIAYLPVNLKIKSLQMMQLNDAFKKPLDYVLDENGITVSQGDTTQTLGWENCVKAVSTRQSILIYTGKNNASVFPRKQLAERLPDFLGTVACYMDPKKVKIRY